MVKPQPALPPGGIAFLLIVVLFGVWLVYDGISGEGGKNPRKHWESTVGKVTVTEKNRAWSDSTGKYLVGPNVGYDISIMYDYQAGGVALNGVFTYYEPSLTAEPKYLPTRPVTVFFNPDNPVESSLEKGDALIVTAEMNRANIISGGILVAIGVFFLFLLHKKSRSSALGSLQK